MEREGEEEEEEDLLEKRQRHHGTQLERHYAHYAISTMTMTD